MTLQNARFGLRQMMVVVAGCALFCALARLVGVTMLLFAIAVPAPLIGALIHRRRDGGGILGGVVGGMIFTVGGTIWGYVQLYLHPQPNVVAYAGPGLTLLAMGFWGALFGFVVGLFVWGTLELADKIGPN
jgi:hypothetical protein